MFRELQETILKELEAARLWWLIKQRKKKLWKELDVNSRVEKYNNWKELFMRGT